MASPALIAVSLRSCNKAEVLLPRDAKKDLVFDLIETREKARKLISYTLIKLKTPDIEKAEKELVEAAKRVGLSIRQTYEEIVKQLENLLKESSLTH